MSAVFLIPDYKIRIQDNTRLELDYLYCNNVVRENTKLLHDSCFMINIV